ncbi:hypothetical protein P0Y35_11420 [Kiritimatiellaeota bacterium B1221]|nr:hypothetical protein [Kiritimatiellaeota bacterium B1221]
MSKTTRLVILLFGLCAGIASRQLDFDDDEFQHAHMAWLLARGEVPHQDFFEHHLPIYHFFIAPLTLGDPGPERILTLRAMSVLIAVGTLIAMNRMIQCWCGKDSPCILALVAFSPIFFIKMIEVRPEGFCLLLTCCAIAGLKKPKGVFLAGLLSGAMVMGSQKFVFLAAGLFLLAWREHGLKALLKFCSGGIIPPLLIGSYFLATASLPQAFHDLVILNLGWKESFSPSMYGVLFWNTSSLLIVSGILGLFTEHGKPSRRTVLICLLSGFAAVVLVPIPFRQTFLMLYPGLALGAALCWQQFSIRFENPKPKMAAGLSLCLFGLLPAASNLQKEFQASPTADLDLMRQMDSRGNGAVFDGRRLLFYRDHVGHYPWMHQGLMMMLEPEEHALNSKQALLEMGYPDILWDYRVDMMSPLLHQFIQTHYVPISPAPLWVPGKKIDRSRLRSGCSIRLPTAGTYIAAWQGGKVFINDREIMSGDRIYLNTDSIKVKGNGFIRNFIIHRTGASE